MDQTEETLTQSIKTVQSAQVMKEVKNTLIRPYLVTVWLQTQASLAERYKAWQKKMLTCAFD
ncbi:hypothetical protein [Mariprofundus sp. EBB-1]|uniref:hypothetical protein n=1 Tax=Mariprofundus sp. EBB-1 TaxID=2650971 RepID=UPI0011C38291|nr:hypothetical protein [Mariprofundus sp. EBB-1]